MHQPSQKLARGSASLHEGTVPLARLKDTQIYRHIISLLVDNEAGVLARVIGLISSRGYNIESLTVAEVDRERALSRINIATSGTHQVIEQIKAQFGRLIPVHQVRDLTDEGPSVARELALVKVFAEGDRRAEAFRIGDVVRARVVDIGPQSFVFEVVGDTDKIDAFIGQMNALGLTEISRTGIAAISRGANGFMH